MMEKMQGYRDPELVGRSSKEYFLFRFSCEVLYVQVDQVKD